MKVFKITVYKGNASEPDTTIKIPLAVLKIVNALAPKKVREKMISEGIDLQEILKAAETKEASGQLMEIQDKEERVIISIE